MRQGFLGKGRLGRTINCDQFGNIDAMLTIHPPFYLDECAVSVPGV